MMQPQMFVERLMAPSRTRGAPLGMLMNPEGLREEVLLGDLERGSLKELLPSQEGVPGIRRELEEEALPHLFQYRQLIAPGPIWTMKATMQTVRWVLIAAIPGALQIDAPIWLLGTMMEKSMETVPTTKAAEELLILQ